MLENRPEMLSHVMDKKRKNLRHMIARYLSTAIPDIQVEISFSGQKKIIKTDECGYFMNWFEVDHPLDHTGWQPVDFCIHDTSETKQCIKTGEVLIVDTDAPFGIISDIDDTVLVSHATQLLRKLRLILTKNAKTRLPFVGVKEFYQALTGNNSANPIFYVSSSEWNLYDFLVDFFATKHLPKGPFLLQEFKSGIKDLIRSGGGSHMHKTQKIHRLMKLYPSLSFVLIGDSGQRDPEIYADIAAQYPARVKAIYIRAVGKKKELDKKLVKQTAKEGVEMVLVHTTEEAYTHALKAGLIQSEVNE
ncbi:App1 family protein [Reichenbachiella agariperforans]|nr:phosphatase domain-containing protein [Reichenbachiella agariperforans]